MSELELMQARERLQKEGIPADEIADPHVVMAVDRMRQRMQDMIDNSVQLVVNTQPRVALRRPSLSEQFLVNENQLLEIRLRQRDDEVVFASCVPVENRNLRATYEHHQEQGGPGVLVITEVESRRLGWRSRVVDHS